jgi:hypothetical protein
LLVDDEKESVEDFPEERSATFTYVATDASYDNFCNSGNLGHILLNANQSFGGSGGLGVVDATGKQPSYVGRYPG